MRDFPASLTDALAGGATTLCRAWAVERTDGVVLGFTDHDRDLVFDGVTFEAESGFQATAAEVATNLSVDTHEVAGALRSDAIAEEDLERGLYDSAKVTLWLVDWRDVASRVLVSRGTLGEVRRRGAEFEAEVVGLAERLNQPFGRAYLRDCDAVLGDARCGVDLTAPQWNAQAVIAEVLGPQRYRVTGLGGVERGFFAQGTARWTSGANDGHRAHVKHQAGETVELWLAPPVTAAAGDALALTAGCDKTAETCRAKFSNFVNFRGFPLMPGDDWAAGYPEDGGAHDGGSLFRR